MRIISRFHDYYDGLNDGADTDHVWKRETSCFLVDRDDPFFLDSNWELSMQHQMDALHVPNRTACYSKSGRYLGLENDSYRRSLLLFCGRFFPLVRLKESVCWRFEEFEAAIDLPNRPFSREWARDKKRIYADSRKMFSIDNIPSRYTTMNLRYKCPVILLDIQEQDLGPIREHEKDRFRVRITLNPRLADLEFQRILPPYDAFQSIETYLFNELAEQTNPPVEISDDIRRDAHGFDKRSFRKDPSKN